MDAPAPTPPDPSTGRAPAPGAPQPAAGPHGPAASAYVPTRLGVDRFVQVRGLDYHVICWGDPGTATPDRPVLFLVHGWMDVGASFQFMVDALAEREGHGRCVMAADWRGFGRTRVPPTDCYWFADYLADLDALLRHADLGLDAQPKVDLLGHSMGGNVVMSYAGVRPERIRKVVNLEGFGLPETRAEEAPQRLRKWLDELASPMGLRDYASVGEVAARLMKNNPRLKPAQAEWLAPHWSAPAADGRWHILGDPAHKRTNPILYRKAEVLAAWRQITSPLLWVEGRQTDLRQWWGDRYPRADFDERLSQVPHVERCVLDDCGHMLHHDQPGALAARLEAFLNAPATTV